MFRKIETLEEARARNVEDALREDVGTGGITESFINTQKIEARIISRDSAVLCGLDWCNECFKRINSEVKVDFLKSDGDLIKENEIICTIYGDGKSILEAERSALNFLQLLSATATTTKKYLRALKQVKVGNPYCCIYDTRKTQPGLRLAQKYAVRIGGGENQRLGLWDHMLFKENHLNCLGGIVGLKSKMQDFHKTNGRELIITSDIQVEVESIRELKLALSMGIKNILLDNFSINMLIQAVSISKKKAVLEVSGGVNLKSLASIAKTGVERISIGNLTKDVSAVDFTMLIKNDS